MNDLAIAGPLQAALADKGYETLTPVQQAVIAPETAGRDLLVSAQTGSGKTVAFGLAIAEQVLGGIDALLPADKPLALVVAPTRELAQQVAAEFKWLYGNAGAQLATCVGGMDYRTEKRALDRGAHIVVGTPGRLRDHIERHSLDLSSARAVVLDEADEMLDLGFAEDLEFILGAAPAERRTLMFSATVPKEIEKLAREFQNDALRVNVQGEARQHADIAYQALSVQARDREHAIFNVLRFHEAQTAIVFCKTRANVNHLFARMVNRGFQAVALSGELSQQERMHALQALRDGRARVCIATDVAARGIDLPGLELVIHADLPSNPDTLLHRSGRTGRAGRKGTSVLIVPPAEFRKAQRTLQGAKVTAEWGTAPGADDVQAREDERLMDHPALAEAPGDEAAMAEAILGKWGAEAVAAAFVRLWRSNRSAPEVLSDSPAQVPTAPLPPRDRADFGPSVWFRLSVGHAGRAEARWLLPKICDAGGIAKDGIGAIRVRENETFVQIAAAAAPRFGDRSEIGPELVMERMAGEPDDRPAPRSSAPRATAPRAAASRSAEPRAYEPRSPRPDKPAYKPKPPRVVEDGDEAPAAAAAPARKPWTPRPADGEAPRKPAYGDRDDRPARKPWNPDDGAARAPRPARAEGADPVRKPRAPRAEDGGERPAKAPYRSAGFKSHGGGKDAPGRASGYKSHRADGAGADVARPERAERPYARRDADAPKGDRPYARRDGDAAAPRGDKPAYGKPAYGKPAGAKPTGERSYGSKSHAPKGDRPERGEKPAYGAGKPAGGKYGKPARPAAPKADATDTTRRFVPPKRPKG